MPAGAMVADHFRKWIINNKQRRNNKLLGILNTLWFYPIIFMDNYWNELMWKQLEAI